MSKDGRILGGDPVARSPDLDRVLALPRRMRPESGTPEAAELVATVTRWFARRDISEAESVLLDAEIAGTATDELRRQAERSRRPCSCAQFKKPCIHRLRLVQAWALFELGTERGLFGSIGMGFGKTAVALLAPLALEGCRLALLLVKASLVTQITRDYEHLAQHFRVPSIRVHGASPYRCQQPGDDVPVLHVLSYNRLSVADSSTFLDSLQPDLIIADEMQNIGDRNSARTKRVLRYFAASEAAGRDVRFCGMTGTITDSSILDYWMLMLLALREAAPMPTAEVEAIEWASALDPSPWPAEAGALEELDNSGEHVQTKYYRRLVETAGVVSTVDASTDAKIEIRECVPAGGVPKQIDELLREVRTTWLRPDGLEFFEDKIAQWRCLHNLACGFYHRWIFTRGSDSEIETWVARRKAINKEIRDQVARNWPNMDSPLLCRRAAARFAEGRDDEPGAPVWDSWAWEPWIEVADTVEYYSEAVRVDDFVARDAANWALDAAAGGDPGVVWYESVELGLWISEFAELPLHDGGNDAGPRMDAERGDRSVIASIKSHGTGRDGMQFKFRRARFCQPFASPAGWEQAIARLARPGIQDLLERRGTNTVEIDIYGHTEELQDSLEKARERAEYVERTTGTLQKILAGRT